MYISIRHDKDLEIYLEDDDREAIEICRERGHDDIDILFQLTEHYWTNGSFHAFDPDNANPFVGLTSAPCVAQSMDVDDNGDRTIEGNVWWYPDYAVKSFIDEMLRDGFVIFPLGIRG